MTSEIDRTTSLLHDFLFSTSELQSSMSSSTTAESESFKSHSVVLSIMLIWLSKPCSSSRLDNASMIFCCRTIVNSRWYNILAICFCFRTKRDSNRSSWPVRYDNWSVFSSCSLKCCSLWYVVLLSTTVFVVTMDSVYMLTTYRRNETCKWTSVTTTCCGTRGKKERKKETSVRSKQQRKKSLNWFHYFSRFV